MIIITVCPRERGATLSHCQKEEETTATFALMIYDLQSQNESNEWCENGDSRRISSVNINQIVHTRLKDYEANYHAPERRT